VEKEEPCKIARSVAKTMSAQPGALPSGEQITSRCGLGCFRERCCVRYFDYNDTYLSKEPAHPSDNVPACIAAAEWAGASGRDVTVAIVLAYEVQCRFADAVSIRARGGSRHVRMFFGRAGRGEVDEARYSPMKHALGIAGVTSAALRQSRVGELSHWKGVDIWMQLVTGSTPRCSARAGMTGPAPHFRGRKRIRETRIR